MKFKSGDLIQLTKEAVTWKREHANEIHGVNQDLLKLEGVSSWLMDKFSDKIYGVVLDPYSGHDGCSLCWLMSDVGEDIEFMETKSMRAVK